MIILLLIATAFWAVVLAKQVLFWVYLWQLKEYRRDRMRAHFELPSSRATLLNRRGAVVVVLLAGSILTTVVLDAESFNIGIALATIVLYGFFAARAGEQFQSRALRLPRFTVRTIATLAISAVLYIVVTGGLFVFVSTAVLPWLFVGDLAAPAFVAVAVAVFAPARALWKRRLLEQARQKRASFDHLLVIGITGSYGKTSMKEFLAEVLSEQFRVLKTAQNRNTDVGVARTILDELTEEYDIFIVEMGAYSRGEITLTASVAQPTMGVLTGIGPQHLSLFGSLQNIQEAKYELIEALPQKGLAIFNGDDELARALFRQCKRPKRFYTADPLVERTGQSIVVEDVRHTAKGTEISLGEGRHREAITTSLLGRHNVTNLIGAITLARALGMEYAPIKKAITRIQPPPHTLRIRKGIKESTVIDDTYSGNVNGVFAALDVLQRMRGRQKICIMHPLIELGPNAERAHRDIGAKIGEVCDWCIMTSADYFAPLYREALEAGMSKDAIFALPSTREALRKAQEITDEEDIILLENRVPQALLDGLVIYSESPEGY